MYISDFVMLGKAAPETDSTGSIKVCTAGVSATAGMVRIYPLGLTGSPSRWSVSGVNLQRPTSDSRAESWSLMPTSAGFETQSSPYPKQKRSDLLSPYVVSGINEANKRFLSLALLHVPNDFRVFVEHNKGWEGIPFEVSHRNDLTLKVRDRFRYCPKLEFKDTDGRHNHLQIRDWGVYELMRKQPMQFATRPTPEAKSEYIAGALHINSTSSLLVGNLAHQRNAWVVISVLSGLRTVV